MKRALLSAITLLATMTASFAASVQDVPLKDIDGKDVIRYARSVDEAKEQKANIGTEPLVIKAVGATGHFKGDILISDEDAKAILEAEKHGKFLSNRKVIVAL